MSRENSSADDFDLMDGRHTISRQNKIDQSHGYYEDICSSELIASQYISQRQRRSSQFTLRKGYNASRKINDKEAS